MKVIPPLSESQKAAYRIRDDCPLSAKSFGDLCWYVGKNKNEPDKQGFRLTLEFIRAKHIKKSKVLDWLQRNNIKSDHEFMVKVWAQICLRVVQVEQSRRKS